MKKQIYIFEKYPKLTLLAVAFALGVIVIMAIEMVPIFPKDPLLGAQSQTEDDRLKRRVARLKEHLPGYVDDITPTDQYMKGTDSLEQKAYRLEIDVDGFIKPSTRHESPDVKIVFMGGSTTEVLYVDPERRFPYLVAKNLEKKLDIKINSFNAGVSGNHSMHSNINLLTKVLPKRPDFVVMMHAGNDLGTMLLLDSYWNNSPTRGLVINEYYDAKDRVTFMRSLKSLIYTSIPNSYTLLKKGTDRIRISLGMVDLSKQGENTEDEFFAQRGKALEKAVNKYALDFRDSLETFVYICRAWGITPILMSQPNRLSASPDPIVLQAVDRLKKSNGVTYEEMREYTIFFDEIVESVARELEVHFIDLNKAIPKSSDYMYDAMHYNNDGSELVARKISVDLKQIIELFLSEKNTNINSLNAKP